MISDDFLSIVNIWNFIKSGGIRKSDPWLAMFRGGFLWGRKNRFVEIENFFQWFGKRRLQRKMFINVIMKTQSSSNSGSTNT